MKKWMHVIKRYTNHVYQDTSSNLRMRLPLTTIEYRNPLDHKGKIYSQYCREEFKRETVIGCGSFGSVTNCLHPYKG